jgi:ADP-ribose pyrophosphatase YjhB (NUDIX family)
MKNFEFEWKGNKYWYSRSIAVVGLITLSDKEWNWYILANKRGKNTPDYQGCWCLPCGYLDFGETCEEALKREVFEETGYKIKNLNEIKLLGIDSEVNDPRQNVTIRYSYFNQIEKIEDIKLNNNNADDGEVDAIKFIKIADINNYNWAFNHLSLIKKGCR